MLSFLYSGMEGDYPLDLEKKVQIRPRGFGKKEGDPIDEEAEGETDVEETKIESKLRARLKHTGTKFPARASGTEAQLEPSKPEPTSESELPVLERSKLAPKSDIPDWERPPPENTTADKSLASAPPRAEQLTTQRLLGRLLRARLRVWAVVLFSLLLALAVGTGFYRLGIERGISQSLGASKKEKLQVSATYASELDAALVQMRTGDANEAYKQLMALEKANSGVSSLTYLVGLAAMQAGNPEVAMKKVEESIAKNERVSDCLALQAVLQTQIAQLPSRRPLGDPVARSEALLRQAMIADAASPFPMIELASLLRYQRRDEEAQALLRGALSRLLPVDSHVVANSALALSILQGRSDEGLVAEGDPTTDVVAMFSAAYVAMRKGNFPEAVELLNRARTMTTPELFDYLVNDPALRRFARSPEIETFYR